MTLLTNGCCNDDVIQLGHSILSHCFSSSRSVMRVLYSTPSLAVFLTCCNHLDSNLAKRLYNFAANLFRKLCTKFPQNRSCFVEDITENVFFPGHSVCICVVYVLQKCVVVVACCLVISLSITSLPTRCTSRMIRGLFSLSF